MYEGLSSPNIHTPKTLSEYGTIMLHNSNTSLWAGGTYIMTRPDAYPSRSASTDNIVYLGEIEELHRFQRNDRVADFGAMVTLYDMMNLGKNVLPKLLIDNIRAVGSSLITKRATIGGALSTPDMTTSFPGSLIALNANVEVKYVKKKIHSRWLPIIRLVEKNGKVTLPSQGLISRVRIGIDENNYHKFYISDNYMAAQEDAIAIAFVGQWDQDILQNAHMVMTFPKLGVCFSRDIDNLFSSIRFPLVDNEYTSIESVLLTFVESTFQITPLQKAIIKGFLGEMVGELNQKALSLPISDNQ